MRRRCHAGSGGILREWESFDSHSLSTGSPRRGTPGSPVRRSAARGLAASALATRVLSCPFAEWRNAVERWRCLAACRLQRRVEMRVATMFAIALAGGCQTDFVVDSPSTVLAPEIPGNVFETLNAPADAHAELC